MQAPVRTACTVSMNNYSVVKNEIEIVDNCLAKDNGSMLGITEAVSVASINSQWELAPYGKECIICDSSHLGRINDFGHISPQRLFLRRHCCCCCYFY